MQMHAPFVTRIVDHIVEGVEPLNAQLTAALVAESESIPTRLPADRGRVWMSPDDLSRRGGPVFGAFHQMLSGHLFVAIQGLARASRLPELPPFEIRVRSWGTVMRDRDYVPHHDHEESMFASVYYADAGDADFKHHPHSGRLSFVESTRVCSGMPGLPLRPSTFDVQPRSGQLLLFPGYLHHYVHTYRGSRPRVCVSSAIDVRTEAPVLSPGESLSYPARRG